MIALRNRLAEEIETASSRDLAALSKQMTDVLAQIEAMPVADATSAADEIAKRREERRKNAGNEA
ncbi:hypothetical protein [Nocardioides abyssi]|uniref:Uncharacterized protein n=1 Tax=Nocardioides abyssi TaxID=3058370 RepID=A0ABT8EXT2_9ACTN|nr:hypothetical protein [Nocardioides abyssi]MDN4162950.1 hypothetical protein [Nocardioides abyssi]